MGAADFSLPSVDQAAAMPLAVEQDGILPDTVWVTMHHDPRRGMHNFSLPLLHQLHAMVQSLQQRQRCSRQPGTPDKGAECIDEGADTCMHEHGGKSTRTSIEECAGKAGLHEPGAPVHYAVMRSDHADYFNAGGDLKYFRQCIDDGNRQGLYQYSMLCLEVLLGWAGCSAGQTSTIALVQGRALGGGFEAALAADYLIAEEHSSFGFPEIMFGLFPCTGAMSLLSRRISPALAERMMTNGKIYSATELFEMGVVDAVCPRGQGVRETSRFISAHTRRRRARQAVERSRKRQAPLDYRELASIVEDWVELALSLDAQALKVMDMLILMQDGLTSDALRH